MSSPLNAIEDSPASSEHPGGQVVPVLSGAWPLLGHLLELRKRPIELFQRVRDELGEIGELNFAGNRIVSGWRTPFVIAPLGRYPSRIRKRSSRIRSE
jgi:hypothetical protein